MTLESRTIVQKLVAKGEASGEGNSMILSDDERRQLMEDVVSIAKVTKQD
jgi:dihydrodipicolinate synthase/N-acetylneuraminate lyase